MCELRDCAQICVCARARVRLRVIVAELQLYPLRPARAPARIVFTK